MANPKQYDPETRAILISSAEKKMAIVEAGIARGTAPAGVISAWEQTRDALKRNIEALKAVK